ncbi:hypothetical protein [Micromonospora sp. DT47]|uniref:hypothetical protein n=1 Tax=Micromonospora sp. DT47 TaxID=3393431 RepID=UPI003CF4284C
MRTRVHTALLASVLAVSGCTSAEQSTTSTSPSPSPSEARYALTPQICSQIDFSWLDRVIPVPPTGEVNPRNWFEPANFMYTGGIQCMRTHESAERKGAVVTVGLATYKSAEGARLAYDTRLVKQTTEVSLPGIEQVSHAHDDDSERLYVRDGNLFVEVVVLPLGDRTTFAQAGMTEGKVIPAVEELAARVIERLRSGVPA